MAYPAVRNLSDPQFVPYHNLERTFHTGFSAPKGGGGGHIRANFIFILLKLSNVFSDRKGVGEDQFVYLQGIINVCDRSIIAYHLGLCRHGHVLLPVIIPVVAPTKRDHPVF